MVKLRTWNKSGRDEGWYRHSDVLTSTVLRVGITLLGIHPAYEPIAHGTPVVISAAFTGNRNGQP